MNFLFAKTFFYCLNLIGALGILSAVFFYWPLHELGLNSSWYQHPLTIVITGAFIIILSTIVIMYIEKQQKEAKQSKISDVSVLSDPSVFRKSYNLSTNFSDSSRRADAKNTEERTSKTFHFVASKKKDEGSK
ncbi:hypothetical protein ACFSR7_05885 [Cohnella sp. GCM10020058]|uniref:hypothetical protein n=1 Tax=Cohnella sp. GCM10020058 TaxID=3317330 RepID=UPI00363DD20B